MSGCVLQGGWHRLTIVCGHYGTGKTEFSVNLALCLAAAGKRVVLADLDIVNPYFRSRERKKVLEAAGVQLISSSQACSDADVPALPAELLSIFDNEDVYGVLDIGGDPVGARVLARFQPKIVKQDYQLIYVANANRPEVASPEQSLRYLRSIEAVSGLVCSGIINNTHLCDQTDVAEIIRGADHALALSELCGIELICHVVEKRLVQDLPNLEQGVFPISIQMKKPWE